MKRAMFSVLTLIVIVGLTGCATQHGRHPLIAASSGCTHAAQGSEGTSDNGCPSEQKGCCRLFKGRQSAESGEEPAAAPGPATGAVTYPYYTVRGPRDFLAKNPQSIGP